MVARRVFIFVCLLVGVALASVSNAGAFVYWTSYDNLGRAETSGAAVNRLFITGARSPEGVAVDAGHIYWANYTRSTIGRANLDGSGVNQNFITGATAPEGIAVDAGHIYWASHTGFDTGTIGRANLDGSGVDENFITGASSPRGVAVDAGHIYWTDSALNAIGIANLDGSGVSRSFIANADQPTAIAVDSAHIYWSHLGKIARASLAGADLNLTFITAAGYPYGIAVDGANIYWGNYAGTSGSIGRAKLDGSAVNQSFIAGVARPYGVAVDATSAPPPTTMPVISGLRQSANTWRTTKEPRRAKPPVGTTFYFSLNQRATVTFLFTQKRSGRKVNGHCVSQTRQNARRPRCSQTVTVATLKMSGRQGANKLSFAGRISPTKVLKPGTYTAVIYAINTAQNSSKPRTLTFTIVR